MLCIKSLWLCSWLPLFVDQSVLQPLPEVEVALFHQPLALRFKLRFGSFLPLYILVEIYLVIVLTHILLRFVLPHILPYKNACSCRWPLLVFLSHSSRSQGLVLLLVPPLILELILKFIGFDLLLVFVEQFLVIFLCLEFDSHGFNNILETVELTFEQRVYIFTLLRCSCFLHEVGKVLVEVNRTTFAIPVLQWDVVGEEDHQSHFFFNRPVFMLENGLLGNLLEVSIFGFLVVEVLWVLVELCVAFGGSGWSAQWFFHLIGHDKFIIVRECKEVKVVLDGNLWL